MSETDAITEDIIVEPDEPTTDLAVVETSAEIVAAAEHAPVRFTDTQRDLLASTIAKGAQGGELELFVNQCERTGLDPFTRQIYFIRAGGKMTVITSIDGLRLIAQRTGLYGGQDGPEWCGPDGKWVDVWLSNDAPAACRVGVKRRDWAEPLWSTVTWAEFGSTSNTWKSMPSHMLSKVAESHGLRKAFPNEMSGLYTSEEMQNVQHDDSGDRQPRGMPAGQRKRVEKAFGKLRMPYRDKIEAWLSTDANGEPTGHTMADLKTVPAALGEQIEDLIARAAAKQSEEEETSEPFDVAPASEQTPLVESTEQFKPDPVEKAKADLEEKVASAKAKSKGKAKDAAQVADELAAETPTETEPF